MSKFTNYITELDIINFIENNKIEVEFINMFRVKDNRNLSRIKLTLKCKNNHIYEQSWDNLKKGCGCKYCKENVVGKKKFKYTKEFVIESLLKENMIILNEYKDSGTTFKYKCLICGNEGKTNFGNFLNGRRCRKCKGMAKKTTEEFKLEISKLTDNKYELLSEYIDNKTKVIVHHTECGNVYEVKPGNFISGKRCPICNESKGERKIRDWLIVNDILFESQKEFEGLIGLGGKNLSYDFYIPKQNILIEYQGEYHDGTANNQTEEDFKKQKEHDDRKREYVKSHNINLLEIWYWDFDSVENILERGLMQCTV
jgi:hypothetical protein